MFNRSYLFSFGVEIRPSRSVAMIMLRRSRTGGFCLCDLMRSLCESGYSWHIFAHSALLPGTCPASNERGQWSLRFRDVWR